MCAVFPYYYRAQNTSFLKMNPNSLHFCLRTLPSVGTPQKNTVTFPFLCSFTFAKILHQFGLPALVRDFRPVTRSRCSFLKFRSMASWRKTDFMSVFCRAEVTYMCISRNLSRVPPVSACSISSSDSKLTNPSKLFLVSVDPEEVYFFEIIQNTRHVSRPPC